MRQLDRDYADKMEYIQRQKDNRARAAVLFCVAVIVIELFAYWMFSVLVSTL